MGTYILLDAGAAALFLFLKRLSNDGYNNAPLWSDIRLAIVIFSLAITTEVIFALFS